jgi:hypothetical protein
MSADCGGEFPFFCASLLFAPLQFSLIVVLQVDILSFDSLAKTSTIMPIKNPFP